MATIYAVPRLVGAKSSTAGRRLAMLPKPLLEVVLVFPLVIRNEKWKEGTFSGWSYGVRIGYL